MLPLQDVKEALSWHEPTGLHSAHVAESAVHSQLRVGVIDVQDLSRSALVVAVVLRDSDVGFCRPQDCLVDCRIRVCRSMGVPSPGSKSLSAPEVGLARVGFKFFCWSADGSCAGFTILVILNGTQNLVQAGMAGKSPCNGCATGHSETVLTPG